MSSPGLIERQLLRCRNGLAYAVGANRPAVAQTPRDLIWQLDKGRLWRYRNEQVRYRPPVLIVHSLVSKSYILDLLPGASLVRFLRDEGFDVFLLDWEPADPADAENTLETYVEHYIPRAITATCEASGADALTLIVYCFAGVMTLLLAAGAGQATVTNLMTLTTPCDYREMGLMSKMFLSGRLDPEDVIDETGLVPAIALDEGFQSLKPTDQLVQQVNLWQNLWNDKWLEGYLAINRWARDQVPFPGAAFRQTVEVLIRANALYTGEIPIGRGVVHLADIRCPYLNVYCDQDTIVPPASTAPLTELAGSSDLQELRLQSGHVGLVAGRTAAKVAQPAIAEWLRDHSSVHPTRAVAGAGSQTDAA